MIYIKIVGSIALMSVLSGCYVYPARPHHRAPPRPPPAYYYVVPPPPPGPVY